MARPSRTVYTRNQQTIDHSTGEVTASTTSNIVRISPEPEYVKMYLADLGQLMHLTAGEQELLTVLVRKIDWDGMISLNSSSRKRICETLGIASKSLRNRLTGLCKKEILSRNDTNEYEVNPYYFARGEWRQIQERRKYFELCIRYGKDGRKVTTYGVDE